MSVTLTYDGTLARVRLAIEPGLLHRYTFATSTEQWAANGAGTVSRVASPSLDGDGSLHYVPPGAVATVGTVLGGPVLMMRLPAAQHILSLRVLSSAGHADVVAAIDWYDAGGANISTGGLGAPVNCPAGVWTTVQSAPLTPPVNAVSMRPRMRLGSTPAITNLFDMDSATVLESFAPNVASIKVERAVPGQPYRAVRGGRAITATGSEVLLDDYEFGPGVLNTYRVTYLSDVGVTLGSETITTTPTIDRVWLKSIARPFLNTPVEIQDYTDITRKGRAGLFTIPNRSFPVRVGDVAGARSWSTTVLTRTPVEARAVEFLIASGDVVLVQVPPAYDIPGGYVDVADLSITRFSRTLADERRLLTLGMNEIAAPAETIVGYTSTWAGILADFGTWTDVLAAFATWADVLEYVADPSTVVVP